MLIRTEAPADILPVDRLLKRVFPSDHEANLVMSLRENSHLTLALVACDDEGELVGYVMFSPVSFTQEIEYWQQLAPLAVDPQYQNQGIGRDLVQHGLECLADFSYPACVVAGDIAFYEQFGFVMAKQHNLSHHYVSSEQLLVKEITPGALDNAQGELQFSEEFSA